MRMLRYYACLPTGRIVLWCYLIWYLVNLSVLFDPSPSIWLNSLGISLIIGFALLLSVSERGIRPPASWQTFRLFLMPFCVSSFSSLIKGRGYLFIFPGEPRLLTISVLACLVFVTAVRLLKTRFDAVQAAAES